VLNFERLRGSDEAAGARGRTFKIRRGLDLRIAGAPREQIDRGSRIRHVAVLGPDYPGMKPTLLVRELDEVRKGQPLFEDKKAEGIVYTAPAAGTVTAINRGLRRVLQSVVIAVGDESDELTFASYGSGALATLKREEIQAQLVESGQWTAIRSRPFGRVPTPGSVPHSIFVTAIDTNPLAPDPAILITEQETGFRDGLTVLGRLTDGPVWLCRAPGARFRSFAGDRVREAVFAGVHPAGNPGTHIHFLDPVGLHKTVWTVGYQDVIAIGRLFTAGRLHTERVVALAGPQVVNPRLLRTRSGASLDDLTAGELKPGENRVISGSVFNGHAARGPLAYLGRLANQVTVLREGKERRLLGYLSPGIDRHSVFNIYLSRLLQGKVFEVDTSTNGSERAIVPLGQYEEVMPLDILPTQLLRAIVVGDDDGARALGALELVEEDLALCSYVCAGKYDYGPILRDVLTRIEQEG
jgi:Na+-transporting NADH:ubiquinone oxidoreductase subunit A